MKTRGLVFDSKRFRGGAVSPPLSLPDVSRFRNNGTFVNNPAWVQLPSGIWVIEFDATNYITIPASATSLNFTSQSFTILAWINIFDYVTGDGFRIIFMRGHKLTDGYIFQVSAVGRLTFVTWQAAAAQDSRSDAFVIEEGIWYQVGAVRSGASVRLYRNGIDITTTMGVHFDPLTCNRVAKIGVDDNTTANHFYGRMLPPVILNYALDATAISKHFEAERRFLGG